MKVPLLDLNTQLQTIEKDVKAAVNDVIDSTRYIMGPKIEELEAKIAEYADAKYAAKHTIALPIYPELTTEMQDYIADKLLS